MSDSALALPNLCRYGRQIRRRNGNETDNEKNTETDNEKNNGTKTGMDKARQDAAD